jgi:hypothetical protein
MEPVHEFGEPLKQLAAPDRALKQAEVEARVEIEQDTAEAPLPASERFSTRELLAQPDTFRRQSFIRSATAGSERGVAPVLAEWRPLANDRETHDERTLGAFSGQ